MPLRLATYDAGSKAKPEYRCLFPNSHAAFFTSVLLKNRKRHCSPTHHNVLIGSRCRMFQPSRCGARANTLDETTRPTGKFWHKLHDATYRSACFPRELHVERRNVVSSRQTC